LHLKNLVNDDADNLVRDLLRGPPEGGVPNGM